MSPLWFVFWALSLSLSWLLPVHFPPWSTLPADAWLALMAALGGLALVARTRASVDWQGLPCLVAMLVLLPWLQFAFGLLPYAGQAWISSSYLLGFLLALLLGSRWETAAPRQLADGLFLAITIASTVSVGLQLYTWLGLSEGGFLGLFSLGQTGGRPYANLGQPNQLATLLVWGLMGYLWSYLRQQLSGATAIFLACFLLLGLAMTQSRTGLLAVTCIVLAVWLWRHLWPTRQLPWFATGLYVVFLFYAPLLQWFDSALLLGQDAIRLRINEQGELRLGAWQLFIQAILERPVFGYGWTETAAAQIEVAARMPGSGGIFSHSHNLFLDLMLWCGIPIGCLIICFLLHWFWSRCRAVRDSEDAVLMLLLCAVAIHALVEFPLQYAYFLLPAGLVMGIVNVRLRMPVVCKTPSWSFAALWLAGVLALGVTLRDYARVDASYSLLRLEQSPIGQGRAPFGGSPDVWVLTQLREWIKISRQKARAGMDKQELDEMETMAQFYPSLNAAYRLATAFALNNQPDEARKWLERLCKFNTEKECQLAQKDWAADSQHDLRIAGIQWRAER